MPNKKVLIVEDDADIVMVERAYLQASGFETSELSDGASVLPYLKGNAVDLILLDVMLPGKNGYEVCGEIRTLTDAPILMVTARTETMDKLRGLGVGADDYISKPFDPAEMVARVHANLRQAERGHAKAQEDADEISIGRLRIKPRGWKLYKDDVELRLPNKEFELLTFLAENPNIVFSKEQLLEKIWGYDFVGDSATVMVHINRIREKIEDEPKAPKLIETVWGAGYRMNR
ncbi:MAG: response regulator transcription factor [Eubacteriales bacterium]|nr:response regulator transcription factor [Eubacteriales bacterium]